MQAEREESYFPPRDFADGREGYVYNREIIAE
jgi:hypothetical protein